MILFSMKHEFRKLFFVTGDLKVYMTHEEPEFLTDSCDFTSTLLHDFETQVL